MKEEGLMVRNIIFSAQYHSLNKVRDFVGQAAHDSGLSEGDIYQVQLAVDEACTNIIEHAYGGESDKKIDCTCMLGKEQLTVTLEDCGRPFNPGDVPEPNLTTDIEHRSPGGLGLYFMRQLMDEVEFFFDGPGNNGTDCNKVRMVKRKGNRQ